jgi:molybdopterin synthase sulfur carrier subunit
MVKVLIFGLTLRDLLGENEFEVEQVGTTTVKALIDMHPDQFGAIGPFMANREVLVTVNKKIGSEESLVKDGDIVKLTHQSRSSHDGVRDIPV